MKKILGSILCLALVGCYETSGPPIPVVSQKSPALGPYSSAMVHGDTIYLSGIIALDPVTKAFAPANIEAQFAQSFANMQTILAASGTDLEHVIKVTVYLKNGADFPALNKVYAEAFAPYKPARTTVPGMEWGRDDIMIELDVIAAKKH
ncbi:MAG: reactive intermediate/imine deaminase [Robiginitomaculum sp.]|nr:MAG: reactive intermediate/imine deaminase [Robiginitomaculum sp.]